MASQKQTGPEWKRVRKDVLKLTQQKFADLLTMDRTEIVMIEHRQTPLTKCHELLLYYIEQDAGKQLKKRLSEIA